MNWTRHSCLILWSGCTLCLAASLFWGARYWGDHHYLESVLVDRILGDFEGSREKLVKITEYVHTRLRVGDTTSRLAFVGPVSSFLKATPRQVDELGGECGDLVRLSVTLLRISGIPARRAHLYNDVGRSLNSERYTHTVVEAYLDGRWVVADPALGRVMRGQDGALLSVGDLADVGVLRRAVGPDYDVELNGYGDVRRVRWSKFPFGDLAYSTAKTVLGERVAQGISYPGWAEYPQAVTAAMLFAAGSGLAVTFWLGRRSGRSGSG